MDVRRLFTALADHLDPRPRWLRFDELGAVATCDLDVDVVALWREGRYLANLPSELVERNRSAWTTLMCGNASNPISGVLAASLVASELWPYREYMNIDYTGWRGSRAPVGRLSRSTHASWCNGGGEPGGLAVALEHENAGFLRFPVEDQRDGLRRKPPDDTTVGSINYSLDKLAHMRAERRVLVAYPDAGHPIPEELARLRHVHAVLQCRALTDRFACSGPGDRWAVIFGYLVGIKEARVRWACTEWETGGEESTDWR